MAIERTVTEVDPGDTRNDILETLAGGDPWVFVYAESLPDGGLGLKVETGGGIRDTATIRNLLIKTLNALPGGDDIQQSDNELRQLRDKFAALAVGEYDGGESCDNAAHNIINVLDGAYDPRDDFSPDDLDDVRRRMKL